MTLKFDRWPWKTIEHLSQHTSSFVHRLIAIGIQTGVTVRKRRIWAKISNFLSCVTLKFGGWPLKNNREPLLCYFKRCVSFCGHMWIGTGVTVRKGLNWVLTSVTLTFDLLPWPLAWTSLLSMVITPENFMIRWQGHSKKVWKIDTGRQTEGQTDGQKELFLELLGRS